MINKCTAVINTVILRRHLDVGNCIGSIITYYLYLSIQLWGYLVKILIKLRSLELYEERVERGWLEKL